MCCLSLHELLMSPLGKLVGNLHTLNQDLLVIEPKIETTIATFPGASLDTMKVASACVENDLHLCGKFWSKLDLPGLRAIFEGDNGDTVPMTYPLQDHAGW